MEIARSPETSVRFCQTDSVTPKDSILRNDRCENFKSQTDVVAWEIGTSVSAERAGSMCVVRVLPDFTA